MTARQALRHEAPAAGRATERRARKRRLSFFFYVACGCALFYFITLAIGVRIAFDLGLWPWGRP